ncbi:MAG TPA: glycosyltransferase [Solirubrobacteraceae bacterium]|nr:glycosyltransferase [Solirubrobacteraceae bacterium]
MSTPSPERRPLRLAVYTDYEYCSDGVRRYGQRAFVVFLEALRPHFQRFVLGGRFDPKPGSSHYPLHEQTELVGLPHYESLGHPLSVARSLIVSVARFWRLLDEIDTVWVLGPYPHSVLLAWMTLLRRRTLVLGVRQDMPLYVRSRRPGRRWMHWSADLLEWIWRRLARRHATVVVGPELERKYLDAGACSVLASAVSLVSERDLDAAERAVAGRDYSGDLTVLTVGRLDAEKNPLLLADIAARLGGGVATRAGGDPGGGDSAGGDPGGGAPGGPGARRWRLLVVGDGPMREQLAARIAELGVQDRVELLGYVPIDGGLLDLYRSSHVFLHVSLTEGFPQVLVEAFASGLPTVATAVGGVRAAAEGAALLIEPGDAGAAADALTRIAEDDALRGRLIEAGLERARGGTLEAATARLAEFLAEVR